MASLGRCAASNDADKFEKERRRQQNDQLVITTATFALTTLGVLAFTVWREPIEDFIYNESMGTSSTFSLADGFGGLLLGLAFYFCSPVQLLLLFFGTFETERPSDWLLRQLGRAAGFRVDDLGYVAPLALQLLVASSFAGGGLALGSALSTGLGDPIWCISAGVGSCVAAAVYEVGRPARLSPQQAVLLEQQWQDFARFADERLQRAGTCHESEVFAAFRRQVPGYRDPAVLSNEALRDMVRNWNPDVKRTAAGYFKGVSISLRVDPFTGEATGMAAPSGAQSPPAGSPDFQLQLAMDIRLYSFHG